MKSHLKYLAYVLRHKWFVLLASWKYGCLWRGLVHDLSKFYPSEWFPYVEYFYGTRTQGGRDIVVERRFDVAWLHHQRRNPHHHQYWLLKRDDGSLEALEMPEEYVREMVADWEGAGRAIHGKCECVEWYEKEKDKMLLHFSTRALVEDLLGIQPLQDPLF